MIDPVTAVGLATTAFNGIKQAIAMGKDIQDMSGQLGSFAKAMSDVDYAHKKETLRLTKKYFQFNSNSKGSIS